MNKYIKYIYYVFLGIIMLAFMSCGTRISSTDYCPSDKELSLIIHVLEDGTQANSKNDTRVYFLTPLPFNKWSDHKVLDDYDKSVYETLKQRGMNYIPASEAQIINGDVIYTKTGKREWMQWISIKWIDSNTAEVDSGVWTCDLGGGGGSVIYQFINGEWKIKTMGTMWVS